MVALFLASILQSEPTTVHDLPTWKVYARELAKAQMIEVHWDYAENRQAIAQYELRVRDRRKVSLEKLNHSKLVWDGQQGILIDHLTREYELLKVKPDFAEAAFLEIPGVLTGKGNQARTAIGQSSTYAGDRGVSVVKVTSHQIDAAAIYTYWFEQEGRRSGTMSWLQIEYLGMWQGGEKTVHHSVRKFDLYAMFDGDTFSLTPPPGYLKKGPVAFHQRIESME